VRQHLCALSACDVSAVLGLKGHDGGSQVTLILIWMRTQKNRLTGGTASGRSFRQNRFRSGTKSRMTIGVMGLRPVDASDQC
jgi:hypothetical protein